MIKGTYTITAINPRTNRSNKRIVRAFSEVEALNIVTSEGLVEPFNVLSVLVDPAEEYQIEWAIRLGIKIPDGINKVALSDLISFREDKDNLPSPDLMRIAEQLRFEFSEYMGEKRMATEVLKSLSGWQQVSFYLACVYQFIKGDSLNGLDFQNEQSPFALFAKDMSADDQFCRSFSSMLGAIHPIRSVLFRDDYVAHFFESKAYGVEKAKRYLQYKFLIKRPRQRQELPTDYITTSTPLHASKPAPEKKTGCFAAVFVMLIIVIAYLLY